MRVMDFYRREGDLIVENWVPIDMIHVLLQTGYDVFDELQSQTKQRDIGQPRSGRNPQH